MQIPVLKKIIAKLNLVHILVKIWEIIYVFAEGGGTFYDWFLS